MDWYAERVPGLEERFLSGFLRIATLISDNPSMFREVDPPVRRALIRGFPYAVFYEVKAEEIVVLSCIHERRSPDRWP